MAHMKVSRFCHYYFSLIVHIALKNKKNTAFYIFLGPNPKTSTFLHIHIELDHIAYVTKEINY